MQTRSSQTDVASTEKLKARLSSNKNSLKDFDEWCLQQFPPLSLRAKVLDLGCGNGKQLHLFSRIFSNKSYFSGLDLSQESLDEIKNTYQSPPQVSLIQGSFDELDQHSEFAPMQFDLIYAVYALYYTKNLKKVIKDVYERLKPEGIFWVIGPDSGTNDEFLKILRPLHEVEPFMDYVFDQFMPEVIDLGTEAGFTEIKPSILKNKVFFSDAESFMHYLRHSLFYRKGHDEAIRKEVEEVVKREGRFTVSKNVLSLQLKKSSRR